MFKTHRAIYFIPLIVAALFAAFVVLLDAHKFKQEQSSLAIEFDRAPGNQQLYKDLAKSCSNSCCLNSVKVMQFYKYEEAKNGKCPEGYFVNGFYCPNSLAWCEPKKDEIKGWQTYRNEEYGFEVTYPSSLYLSGGPPQMLFFRKEDADAKRTDFSNSVAEIRIDNFTDRFEEYFNTPDNMVVKRFGDLKLRSYKIGSFDAVVYGYDEKTKVKEIEDQDNALKGGASVGMIYFPRGLMVNKDGTIIEIFSNSYSGNFKADFDQVLSTFKFIEP